jgi:hypothetical protein
MSDSESPGANQAPFNWRKHLPVHPLADAYPKVPHDRLVEIGEDIRKNGLRSPIAIHAKGDPGDPGNVFELFDGVTRLNSMAAVGIKFEFERFCFKRGSTMHGEYSLRLVVHDIEIAPDAPNTTKIFRNLSDDEIAAHIESANLHRRHLEPEQYHARIEASHARIEAALKRDPEKSDRAHAEEQGVSDKTIAKVRKSTAEGSAVEGKRIGKDGKARKQPKSGSGSPGFKAARKWADAREQARRLGCDVEQLGSGGFKLSMPDGAPPICFHSLESINEKLKEIEEEKADAETDDAAVSGEKQKAVNAKLFDEEAPDATVERGDVLFLVAALQQVGRAIDRTIAAAVAAEVRPNTEHRALIQKAACFFVDVLAALDEEPPPSGPDGGSEPKVEEATDTVSGPTSKSQAQAGTDEVAQTGLIPADLSIPPFMRRTAEASAHDAPVPLTPPAPAPTTPPAPSPAPAPTPPTSPSPPHRAQEAVAPPGQ